MKMRSLITRNHYSCRTVICFFPPDALADTTQSQNSQNLNMNSENFFLQSEIVLSVRHGILWMDVS